MPERPGLEVVAVTTGNLRVLDREGTLLGEADAVVGFTDIAADGRTLYLGSTPHGDNVIYRIRMDGDWEQAVDALERHGLARAIGRNLDTVRLQALSHVGGEAPGGPYLFRVGSLEKGTPSACPPADWFMRSYPYPHFRVVSDSGLGGMTSGLAEDVKLNYAGRVVGGNRDGVSPDEIAHRTAALEGSGRAASFYISHGCRPRMRVETLDRMMEAAPGALRDFVTHEDEWYKAAPGYCAEFLAPLAERCLARGVSLTMLEKNTFWFDVPAAPEAGRSLFSGRYADVLIAGTDDANSRTPELNLLARVGLRQAGLVGRIMSCPITDLNAFNRMQEWEYPKSGSPFFRMLVAHTVLGADAYHFRVDNWYGDALKAESEEGFAPFLHLLGKGIVFAPSPDQMAGLSRVGFAVHPPPEHWVMDGHNGHGVDRWRADPEWDQAVLPHNACFWGLTPTPAHALQAVLLRKRRQFGYHVPPTPYGPFVFVPATADLSKVEGVTSWWHTDGVSVWREGGDRLTGEKAAEAVRASFEDAARDLPFRAWGDDVFFHSVELDDGGYRLFAIDPGWLDPADRDMVIQLQLPGRWTLTDTLTGEALPLDRARCPLRVPAGALRIIDARRTSS